MKIVCSFCETTYQIDDRKVTGTGRVFRVACRSCKELILVDGLDGQGAGLSGWYLNDGDDRQGPMDLEELRSRIAAEEVGSSALIWSNGMDSWRPVADLDEVVAPWESETVQSDDEEEEGETTLISLDEIARVHAEIEARDAPLLGDDEVELVEETAPPDLPGMVPPESLAETVQRAASDEAETRQQEQGEVVETLVFKLDPSMLGSEHSLPDASEVISSSDTGEEVHEVGGNAAALFRLDDLALGNESKSATSLEQGGVGLTSGSLFVGEHSKPTDPSAVQARPRTAGTVTMSVPIVKKKKGILPVWAWAILGIVAGWLTAVAVFGGPTDPSSPDRDSAPVASAEATSTSAAAPVIDKETVPKTAPSASDASKVKPPSLPDPKPVVTAPAESSNQAPKKPAVVPSTAALPAPSKAALPAPDKKVRRSAAKSPVAKVSKARARATRRALRDEPVPDFGRPAKRAKKDRRAPTKPDRKADKSSSAVNDLLGQLKNKSGSGAANDQEQLPQKLSASEVRGTLRKRQSRFKACYRQMEDRPEGAVTVKTSFKIASSGRVSSAHIVRAAGVTAGVKSCILEAVKGAKFPRFRDAEMIVNYPILLR